MNPFAVVLLHGWSGKLIAQRRTSLGDDLLSALIQADEAGDKLTPDELVSMVFLLLVAGHETTVNLISCGTLALRRRTGTSASSRTRTRWR